MTSEEEIIRKSQGRSAGELLKAERIERGLTVEDVANATKIQAKHIKAIEEDNEDDMPSRVYAIGFVRTYSTYMNFDSEAMIQLFKIKTVGRHDINEAEIHSDIEDTRLISWPGLAILNIICLTIMVLMWNTINGEAKPFSIPDVPLSLKEKLKDNEEALEKFKSEADPISEISPEAGIGSSLNHENNLDTNTPSGYVDHEIKQDQSKILNGTE